MDDTTSIRIKRTTVHELTMIRASLQRALHRPVTSHDEAINLLMEQWNEFDQIVKRASEELGIEEELEREPA